MLKVKEYYQYPKLEGEGDNETNVFSREPFIVRFSSPTTCTMKNREKELTSGEIMPNCNLIALSQGERVQLEPNKALRELSVLLCRSSRENING